MPRSRTIKSSPPKMSRRISVGTQGYLRSGDSITKVRVIEDRGNVGWRGNHLLRVLVLDQILAEPRDFEIPESDLLLTKPRLKKV
jgi:hypothetical protein